MAKLKKIKIKEITLFRLNIIQLCTLDSEILPKIFLFSKFNRNKKIILLVDKNLHKNQYQALNLIINKNHIVRYVDKNECIYVEKFTNYIFCRIFLSYSFASRKKHFHGIYSHSLAKGFFKLYYKKTNLNVKIKNLKNFYYKTK